MKRTIIVNLIFAFLFFITESTMALTSLTVTNDLGDLSTGSIRSILSIAKATDDDVLINFNISNSSVISVSDEIDVHNDFNKSIHIDGINLNNPTADDIKIIQTSTDVALRLYTSYVFVENLRLEGGAVTGVQILSGADHATIKNCTIESAIYGIQSSEAFSTVEGTRIENCTTGIIIGSSGFNLGNNNVIICNGLNNSKGIDIFATASSVKIGNKTCDFANYSFIGGCVYGVYSKAPFSANDLFIGGKEYGEDYCNSSSTNHYVNTAFFGNQQIQGSVVIGAEGTNPSVVATNISNGISFTKISDVDILNTSIGIHPFWCNNTKPSSDNILYTGIKIQGQSSQTIGHIVLNGNNIGNATVYGVRMDYANDVEIYNNQMGVSPNKSSHPIKDGVWLYNVENTELLGNEIGNITNRAIYLSSNSQLKIRDNYVGISNDSEQIFSAKYGVTIVNGNDIELSGNYFGAYNTDVRLDVASHIKVLDNKFDAYYNNKALPDQTSKIGISMNQRCRDIQIGEPSLGNQFIGKNNISISAKSTVPAPWLDVEGNSHDYSTIQIQSNLFTNSASMAISILKGVQAEVGSETNPTSGNVILNAVNGIASIDYGYNSRKLSAFHNFIGVSPSGQTGNVNMGINIVRSIDVGTHFLGKNTISNCVTSGVEVFQSEEIKMSQNSITNSTLLIDLNNSSNKVNGIVTSPPTITTASVINDYEYEMNGSTYSNARVEIFRKKNLVDGAYEFIGDTLSDGSGNWVFKDILYAHNGYEGYYVTVTRDNETSELGTLHSFCVSEEQGTGCEFLKNIDYFVTVESGDINKDAFILNQGIMGIILDDAYYDLTLGKVKVYDFKRDEVTDFSLSKYDEDKYIFEFASVSNFQLSEAERVYTLELTNSKGQTTKYRFKN